MSLGLWNNSIYVVILSCDKLKYKVRVKKLSAKLKAVGIDKFYVEYGKLMPANIPRNTKNLSNCIFGTHYDVVKKISTTLAPGKDIFILEDDCEFLNPDAGKLIFEYYTFLKTNYKNWTVFFPGHIPLGPLIPCKNKLFYSTNPYAAHSYILNGQKVERLLQEIPRRKWKRPYIVEGWLKIPIEQKFALHPSITTQIQLPKEMVSLVKHFSPKIKLILGLNAENIYDTSLATSSKQMHYLWLYYIPVIIVIFLIYKLLKRNLTSRR